MTSYRPEQLETMRTALESDLVERKESLRGDASSKIREAVCAFANDLPDHRQPGVVFVGVRDDGSPCGLSITNELLRALSDVKTDGNIVPPPTVEVGTLDVEDDKVAVLVVHPSDTPPVRYRGRVWIRVGPRRAIATAQDERVLNEKRRHRDPHFDSQPVPSATIADLSRRRFEEEYLPLAVDPELLAANDRSYEERLAAAKMVASVAAPVPTIAGILVLGTRPRDFLPGSYLQFLRISGRDLGDPVVDTAECDGPMTDLIRRVDEKIASHNRTAVDLTSGPRESRSTTYPRTALEQLVRNAVLHRTYENTNAPIRLYWFDDRVEIHSPGGPYGLVTVETFGRPGVLDYRNPILAEAMRVLGLVQRFGFGIPIARREMELAGHPPPEFQVDPNWVHCTLRARP
ncbi:MAG: ATP-binding protein [Planctomycetota bacterium]